MTTAIATQADPMEQFYESLKERLRADVAELLPDDALRALAQKAVEESFFKKTVISGRWDSDRREVPSQFEQLIAAAAKPIVERIANEEAEKIRPQIEASITELLDKKTLEVMLALKLGQMMDGSIQQFSSLAYSLGQKLGSNQ